MTTEELERDLTALAAPRAEDERARLAIRATLVELTHARPQRRRRSRLALGAAAVAAAALAAAILGLVGSGGPSANAAILAGVSRALSPPANLIVHVHETGQVDGAPVSAEWWQVTNAPYAMRLIKSNGAYVGEGSADGTTTSRYDAATNTISERPSSTADTTLIDPIETVRAALQNGTAQVSGTVTIDGRSLYKIELPNGVVGYFDQTDYRPAYLDNPQGDGSIVRTKVLAYEELPLTPQNERLVSLTAQHPDARVVTSAAPADKRG